MIPTPISFPCILLLHSILFSCILSSCPNFSLLLLLLQTELHDLLKPISDHIQEIQSFRERNRGSRLFNHLSAVSESIPALGWVAVVRKNTVMHSDAFRNIKKHIDTCI